MGATKPEEYGDYFAWGEVEPYYTEFNSQNEGDGIWRDGKSSGYAWASYRWCNGTETSLTKYVTDNSFGIVDKKTELDPDDDVARVKWRGKYRMPTSTEFMELIEKCTWMWTSMNGVNGYRVTSTKSGYSNRWIFIPVCGCRTDTGFMNCGVQGYYWTSELAKGSSPLWASILWINEKNYEINKGGRKGGYSIRPVLE